MLNTGVKSKSVAHVIELKNRFSILADIGSIDSDEPSHMNPNIDSTLNINKNQYKIKNDSGKHNVI